MYLLLPVDVSILVADCMWLLEHWWSLVISSGKNQVDIIIIPGRDDDVFPLKLVAQMQCF